MKAQDADAKSAATGSSTAFEVYHQDHDAYAGADVAALAAIEPAIANVRGLVITARSTRTRSPVTSLSGPAAADRWILGGSGRTVRTCSRPGQRRLPAERRLVGHLHS